MKEVFKKIYLTNKWGSSESKSGKGSELEATKELRRVLPDLIEHFKIKSMLDLPCGDFNYMKEINLPCEYIGGDIVQELIASNSINYPDIDFRTLDIVNSQLPKVDLILVRDCFVHLPFKDILKALENVSKSCRYMLVTSFPKVRQNEDIQTGGWRALNMELEPFRLSAYTWIHEGDKDERYNDKSLILVDFENKHYSEWLQP